MMHPHSESKRKYRLHDAHITPYVFFTATAVRKKGMAVVSHCSSLHEQSSKYSPVSLYTKLHNLIDTAMHQLKLLLEAMLEISIKMYCGRKAHHPGLSG